MGGRRTFPALLLLGVVVLGAACTDDADDATGDAATDGSGGTVATGQPEVTPTQVADLPVIDPGTPYVQGLCSIDFFAPGDEQDPMGWVIDQLRALPAGSRDEVQEVDWMIERLQRADELDDPLATDDLTSVAAVLRARCT